LAIAISTGQRNTLFDRLRKPGGSRDSFYI
jgi:hypothetical protein